MNKDNNFSVASWWCTTDTYTHWSDGLKMIIQKGDKVIELNSEEIEQIVASLPKTFGGTYR